MDAKEKKENVKKFTVIFFKDWVGFVFVFSSFFIAIPLAIFVSFFSSIQQASIFYINFIMYYFILVFLSLTVSEFSNWLLLGIKKYRIVRVLFGEKNVLKLIKPIKKGQTQIITINSKVFIKRWFSFFINCFALTMTFRIFLGDFVAGVFLFFSSIVIFPFYRTHYIIKDSISYISQGINYVTKSIKLVVLIYSLWTLFQPVTNPMDIMTIINLIVLIIYTTLILYIGYLSLFHEKNVNWFIGLFEAPEKSS